MNAFRSNTFLLSGCAVERQNHSTIVYWFYCSSRSRRCLLSPASFVVRLELMVCCPNRSVGRLRRITASAAVGWDAECPSLGGQARRRSVFRHKRTANNEKPPNRTPSSIQNQSHPRMATMSDPTYGEEIFT